MILNVHQIFKYVYADHFEYVTVKDTEKLPFNDNDSVMTNNSYLKSEARSSLLLSRLYFLTSER